MSFSEPWNGWFHCSGHTNGSWLRGDPRGWRERNHRRHVEGDYRNPPEAGSFERLHERSLGSMKRKPVVLSPEVRPVVRDAMVASLERHDIEVIAIAVASRHFHLLARFVDRQARKLIGIAKKDAARIASDRGLAPPGGLWAKRSKVDPIQNRGHQINTVWYILDHVDQGGAIWAPAQILKAHEARRARKQ